MQVQVNASRVDFGQKADQVLQRAAKPVYRPRQHNVELTPHRVLAQRVEARPLVPTLSAADTAIDWLSRQYPRLVFTVMQAPTIEAQYRDLRERRVDFIFGRMMAPIEDDDLNAEILFEDPLIVVAGAGSKWLRRRKIEAAELIDEPWCLSPYDFGIGSFVAQAFRARGLGARLTVRSNSAHLFYAMVHTGRFLSVAPASTLRLSGKRLGLKAVPVDIPIQPAARGVVTLKNRTLNPVAQLFIDCARKLCQGIRDATKKEHRLNRLGRYGGQ